MNLRPDPKAPGDLRELAYGEHLVVWAMRVFVAGRIDCPVVQREFETACGPLAVEARTAFLVFAQQLVLRGRRRISVSVPGRLTMTRDEQQIAALFADAQSQDQDRFEARLAFLLGRTAEAPFFAAAAVVAQALAMAGRRLRAFPGGQAVAPTQPLAGRAARSVA